MNPPIRIGTRSSALALWQAQQVQQLLAHQGVASTIVPVKSQGDLDLVTPLYVMGVEGVFTKTLDACLLSDKIDIAVHSMKDVPTQLAQGIVQAAVLKRGATQDVFIPNPGKKETPSIAEGATDKDYPFRIATGSVRRKAQWLNRFPGTAFDHLRGNVQTRLKKLSESDWDGIIMAKAGLERMALLPGNYEPITWMLPAPAQGAILVVCREDHQELLNVLRPLNDDSTALSVQIERDFLSTLMGGCSTPISALAAIQEDKVIFKGSILTPDGQEKMTADREAALSRASTIGIEAAQALLDEGAGSIIEVIRKNNPAS